MAAISTIIMAGGLGTRMRSPLPKVLHELCGLPMLAWVVRAARAAGADDVVVVAGPETAEAIAAALPDCRVVVQSPANGTGDAVRVGLEAVPAEAELVVVLSGDTPLIEPETVRRTIEACSGRRRRSARQRAARPAARLRPGRAGRRARGAHRRGARCRARGARAGRVQRRALLLPARRAGGRPAAAHCAQRAGRAVPDRRRRAARARTAPSRSTSRRRRRARASTRWWSWPSARRTCARASCATTCWRACASSTRPRPTWTAPCASSRAAGWSRTSCCAAPRPSARTA